MTRTGRRAGPWLWLPAMACGLAGVCGLADLREATPAGKLLLVGPHIGGVALAAWAGRRRTAAGLSAVAGSAATAGLSWADALDRQAEGVEWRFNNALSGAMCLGANSIVLAVTGLVAVCLAGPDEPLAAPGPGPGKPA